MFLCCSLLVVTTLFLIHRHSNDVSDAAVTAEFVTSGEMMEGPFTFKIAREPSRRLKKTINSSSF